MARITVQEETVPATPSTGYIRLYHDSSDGLLHFVQDDGTNQTVLVNNGDLTLNGDLTIDTDHQIYLANGTATDPSIAFTNSTNSGLNYDGTNVHLVYSGSNIISLTSGGTDISTDLTLAASQQLFLPNGATSDPSLAFSNNVNTGFNYDGTDVHLVYNGTNTISVSSSGTTVDSSLTVSGDLTVNGTTTTINTSEWTVDDINITLADGSTTAAAADGGGITIAGANATITYASGDDTWNFNKTLKTLDGSISAPAYAFSSDVDTGLYLGGTGDARIAVGGADGIAVTTSALTVSSSQVLSPNGAVGTPTYSFSNDSDTGMYLSSAGDLRLAVGGSDYLNVTVGAITVGSSQLEVPDGTNTVPSYTFSTDTDTGLYLTSTGTLAITTAGADSITIDNTALTLNSSQLLVPDGSASTPSYSFTNNTGLGFYSNSATEVRFVTGGSDQFLLSDTTMGATASTGPAILNESPSATNPTVVPNRAQNGDGLGHDTDPIMIAGDNAVMQFSSETSAVNWLHLTSSATSNAIVLATSGSDTNVDLSIEPKGTGIVNVSSQIQAPNGLVSSPAYSFTTDTDTGMYLNADSDLRFAVSGTDYLNVTAGAITVGSSQIEVQDGTNTVPSYTFVNDTDTGLYLSSTGTLAVTTAGTDRLTVNDTALTISSSQVFVPNGAVGTPTYSFSNDNDTGIYLNSVGDLRLAVGGSDYLNVTTGAITVGSSQLEVQDGTESVPSYTFVNDTDTGMYLAATGEIATTVSGSTVTQTDSSGLGIKVSAIQGDLHVGGGGEFLLEDTAAPTDEKVYRWNIDAGGDLALSTRADDYSFAQNIWISERTGTNIDRQEFYTEGSETLRLVNEASAVNYVQLSGSATGNSVTLTTEGSDADIGISLAPKGTGVVSTTSTIQVADGTAGSPAYTFTSDTDTGIYRSGTDTLNVVTNGNDRMVFASGGNVFIGQTSSNIAENSLVEVAGDITVQSTGDRKLRAQSDNNADLELRGSSGYGVGMRYDQSNGQIFAFDPNINSGNNFPVFEWNRNNSFAKIYITNQEAVRVVTESSTVNYIQMSGSATGNGVSIQPDGTDSDIDLVLTAKGQGVIDFQGSPLFNAPFEINNQTGTSYTLQETDANNLLTMDNSGTITMTVPDNATVPFEIGTRIAILQEGTGTVTVSGASGVTINNRQGHTGTAGQWARVEIVKIGTDSWVLSGDTA